MLSLNASPQMCGLLQKAGIFTGFTVFLSYVGMGDETNVLVGSGEEQSIGMIGNVMIIHEGR